ncbi:hypothetical protein Goshw_004290, partial [Gossypium schwendimanii]|nr:hypothetical protein [Gossypium schwendimanii]
NIYLKLYKTASFRCRNLIFSGVFAENTAKVIKLVAFFGFCSLKTFSFHPFTRGIRSEVLSFLFIFLKVLFSFLLIQVLALD